MQHFLLQVPDFQADTSLGPLKFYEWAGNNWVVFFCHPRDRTPVCTTELGIVAQMDAEWSRRGVKVLALSVDDAGSHINWIKEIEESSGSKVKYPVIADEKKKIAEMFGMIVPSESGSETIRSLLIINPDKQVRMRMDYPGPVGRDFAEVLRAVDALQLAESQNLALPGNWKPGQPALLRPSGNQEEYTAKFGADKIKSTKYEYLKFVDVSSFQQGEKRTPAGGNLQEQPNKMPAS
jgi:thioredoxin-dependent peroxiredoxin